MTNRFHQRTPPKDHPPTKTRDSFPGRQRPFWPLILLLLAGWSCLPRPGGEPSTAKVIGRRGLSAGRFHKPRAMAIDARHQLYVVDMTARIQVFDEAGNFVRQWRTPDWKRGKPTGLTVDRRGNLRVADTHYHRILTYTPEGELLGDQTLGGTWGPGAGEFGFVTDVVDDSQGNLYVAEYGEWDRVQKFDADGNFLLQWGGHGSGPGQFLRPQALKVDELDRVWVADACNHRIQVFDASQQPVRQVQCWGHQGTAPGALRYPYDLWLTDWRTVMICEYGNSRIQEFTRAGDFLRQWGGPGHAQGEFHSPWAIVMDADRLFVLDTLNHRIQQFQVTQ